MKAIRYHQYGGPEVLTSETVPIPQPAEGEVLIKVHFAGVNPVDWKFRSGYLKEYAPLTLPHTPGIDVSGTIEAVGTSVKNFTKGQDVVALARGGYAEFALAKVSDVALKPKTLGFDQAASVPVGALTAWQQVEDAKLQPGQTVVVQGGSGGVGLFAVQFAKQKGARVIATASTANVEFVRSLGADQVIDYNVNPIESAVQNVDVVLDTVGGAVLEASYQLLKKGGLLITVAGMISQEKAEALGIRAVSSARGPASALAGILDALAQGTLKNELGKVFPLLDAAQAHQLSETRHGRGRILLKV